jgi:hypothetical protein
LTGKKFWGQSKRYLILIILTFLVNQSYSQVNDTLRQKPAHSPKKAALMSAALPGLGQAYNKKYWKIPVIYAAGGYLFYRFHYNSNRYQDYKEAYADMVSGKIDQFENRTTEKDVKQVRDIYRQNRDRYVIFMAAVYIANILDASVDAYLFDFDVSKELGMRVEPTTIHTNISSKPMPGIRCSFTF